MAKRLYYFNYSGLAEGIRYLLHYAGVEFEDVKYETENWPAIKASFPFGQLPVYEEGEQRLHQTLAISRYLGHAYNLAAGDAWGDAQLDATALTINDFWSKVSDLFRLQGDEVAARKKIFFEETVDFYFSRFEQQLKDNGGFFGEKLSWVDFLILGRIETINQFFDVRIDAKYPTIQALITNIHSYPGVKKYVASRKP